jgi:hypothetical protein
MRAMLGKNPTACGKFLDFGTPKWANGFGIDFKAELARKVGESLIKTYMDTQAGEPSITCVMDRCRIHGYELCSPGDSLKHMSSVHYQETNKSLRTAVNELFRHAVADAEEDLERLQPKGNKKSLEADNDCKEQGNWSRRTRFE